jgi:hypothetical protein
VKCIHGVNHPCEEGKDPGVGPWLCNGDGSNPNCPNCEPNAAFAVVYTSVDGDEDDGMKSH